MRAAFKAEIDTLNANKAAGLANDHCVPLHLTGTGAATNLLDRSIAWTQQDNAELRGLVVRVADSGGVGHTVTARLTVDTLAGEGNNPRALEGHTLEVSTTSIVGVADARSNLTTTSGTRVKLLKGVTYRLEIETTGTILKASAFVLLRSVRRGGDMFDVSWLPHRWRTNGNLDSEKVNENLQAFADQIKKTVDRRYTYSQLYFPLDGLTDTDAAVLRQFAIRAPTTDRKAAICGVELAVTSGDTGVVWTLTQSTTAQFPTVAVTADGANSEQYAGAIVDLDVDDAADTVLTLTASTAIGNQIDAGYLIIHLRCDRYSQGTAQAPYSPPRYDATTVITDDTVHDDLQNVQTAITADLAADEDLRAVVFAVRNVAPGATKELFHIPVGSNLSPWRMHTYLVQAATSVNSNTELDDQGVGGSVVDTVPGGGVAARVFSDQVLNEDAGTNPFDDTQDITIYLENPGTNADNALLMYVVVWFR